jgi:hypothetical protein
MALELAPVLLFTYKRVDVLKQTLAALQANTQAKDTELFVFSDGWKNETDKRGVQGVREYLKEVEGFKRIVVRESPSNKGLANSIIEGVSQVIDQYGKVIVLEDDLITTPNFLSFMNACLDKYKSESQVFSISGYSFNLSETTNEAESGYFLYRGWSWGWATWRDRWNDIDWMVKDYASFLKNSTLQKKFARGGSDLNAMLRKQMNGKMDSWAIRWFYHQFKVNGLTFYPVYSKVYNIGFGEDATHTTGSDKRYIPRLDKSFSESYAFPTRVEISSFFQKKFLQKMGIRSRIKSRFESLILRFTRTKK